MQIAKNILAATDFTLLGGEVVEHALELAGMLDAKLHVVSVYTPVGAAGPVNRETKELRAQMAELEAHFKPSGRLGRAAVECGAPAETILRVATELQADMIVIGTHSRHGIDRWASGSVARAVLRQAAVPVLVLKRGSLRAHATTDVPAVR